MLRVIVTFGREDYEHRRFREQGKTAVDERVKLTVSQSLYTLGVQTTTAAGISLVLGVGAWHVMQGKITLGELIVMMTYIASVYQPLEQLSLTVGTIHEQLVQFNASLDLLDTEPEVTEKPDAVELGRARGRVTAQGVSFTYPGRKDTLSGHLVPRAAGRTGRDRRPHRRRQEHPDEPADPLLRPSARAGSNSTASTSATSSWSPCATRSASSSRSRCSSRARSRTTSATASSTRAKRRCVEAAKAANAHDFISGLPERLRDRDRRARRPDLRRRAAAHLRRPRLPQGRPDPDPRRADLLDRLEDRAGDPRRARRPDGRPNLVHDRPPPLHRPPRRPDPGHRSTAGSSNGEPTTSWSEPVGSTSSCTRRRRASARNDSRPRQSAVNGPGARSGGRRSSCSG